MKISKQNKARIIFSATATFVIASIFISAALIYDNAYAVKPTENDLLLKTLINGLGKCNGEPYLKKEIGANDWNGTISSANILTQGLWGADGYERDRVNIPTQVGNTLASDVISCAELFNGANRSGNMPGLVSLGNVSLPPSASQNRDAAEKFLTAIGYTPRYSASQLTTRCIWTNYGITGGVQRNETNKMCFRVDENGIVNFDDLTPIGGGSSSSMPVFFIFQYAENGGWNFGVWRNTTSSGNPQFIRGNAFGAREYSDSEGVSWDVLAGAYDEVAGMLNDPYGETGLRNEVIYYVNQSNGKNYREESQASAGTGDNVESYRLADGGVHDLLVKYFSNSKYGSFSAAAFSNSEKYWLYVTYITDFYGLTINSEDCADSISSLESSYGIMVNSGGEKKWCGVTGNFNDAQMKGTVNGFIPGTWSYLDNEMDVYALLDAVASDINYDSIAVDDLVVVNEVTGRPENGIVEEGSSADATDQDECMRLGGAMGWLFCPAITGLRGILEGIYDGVITPMLQIDSDLMSTEKGAYVAWGIFRNIANIFFVFMLLFIIFSQVTGYGIDNYGIKRMLPKLVIVAVLVNFSFTICQLAVDISNILGAGLRSMLASLGGSAQVSIGDGSWTISNGADTFSNAMAALLGVIGIAGTVGATWMLFTSPGIIISILVALLGVLVAVLFMFISLGARMAGVVVLTVISPLAFIAYALPNTNGLYKRWFDIFKALLLLYPICGLLVGGGQFASVIILGSLDANAEPPLVFFYVMIALLICVIPFFALPALLKRSISALGGVGNAIGNLGGRLRGATQGIRQTEAYKRARTNVNTFDPGGLRGKAITRLSKGRFTRHIPGVGMASRGMARNLAASDKQEKEDTQNLGFLQDRYDTKANVGTLQNDFIRAQARGDERGMSIALGRMAGMDVKAAQNFVTNQVGSLDNLAGDKKQRDTLRRIKSAVDSNDNLSKSLASKDPGVSRMLANNGQLNGSYSNLAGFTRSFAETADAKDVAGLSGGALARVVQSGGLTDTVKREVLNSTDPAIRTVLDSDPTKRNILNAMEADMARQDAEIQGPPIDYTNKAMVQKQSDNWLQVKQEAAKRVEAENKASAAQAEQEFIDRLGESIGRSINQNNQNNPNP